MNSLPDIPPHTVQRIDRLLWMLRLSRTRGAAQGLIGQGHVRVNGRRVLRCAQPVGVGDVITIPHGIGVRVVEILALPVRRGPAIEARTYYRDVVHAQVATASQQCSGA